MSTIRRTFDVVSGPSKDLLFDACKYASGKITTIHPEFRIAQYYMQSTSSSKPIAVYMPVKDFVIVGIRNENNSGESWWINGHVMADLDNSDNMNANLESYTFEMYYDSRCRTGSIHFIVYEVNHD